MIPRAHTRTALPRTSQPLRKVSFFLTPTVPALELCISPSTPSPKTRFFAWRASEDDAGQSTAQFTHTLLSQPDGWETTGYLSTAFRLHRRPERLAVLQTGVSVKRHFSSYFPCSPSVTRFGAYPAPCGTARLCFFGFQKIFSARTQRPPKEKIFRTFRKCVAWPWERGTLASLRARVSRGHSGKYNQGELTWHSTKTT